MTFRELGLSEKVLQAVEASGYTTPTPIQAQAIPEALAGRDVLGIAQTGTGKTAAFTLPMLSRLEQGRARARMPRTLILEPTRELAAQVEESFRRYGINHKLNVALLIGGVSFGDQETKIMRGADVLIATPGRLLDFAERGKLLLTGIEILVIDEADRMLDMGFIPDIERICKLVPFTRQTLFFSATMPTGNRSPHRGFPPQSRPHRSRPGRLYLRDHRPGARRLARPARPSARLCATFIRSVDNFKNAIIFCNRKRDVAILHKSLQKHGFRAGALHGDMDQRSRMASLDAFKNGDVDLIVCSDVAARGLDIPDVSHVFNFDVPVHAEDYVHRIGRTGRAGKLGTAISIVTRADQKHLAEIEKLIGRVVEWQQGATLDTLVQDDEEEASPRHRSGRRTGSERTRAPREHSAREPREHSKRTREAPHDAPKGNVPAAAKAHDPRSQEARPQEARSQEPRQHEPRQHAPKAPEQKAPDHRERSHQRPDRARSRDNGHDDQPVVGMGDHVPSFLLRPVKLKPSVVEEAEEA